MNKVFKVSSQIFEMFPDAKIGLLVVKAVDNNKKNTRFESLLKAIQKDAREKINPDAVLELSKIKDWREAYLKFGCKPSMFRSSIEALLRRIVKNNFVTSISPVVDAYNYISIKYQLCVGAMDIECIDGDLALTLTSQNDSFRGIGEREFMPVSDGEVAYKDSSGDVLCRAWNWRESDKSKITDQSKNILFLIEGLASTTKEEVLLAIDELGSLVSELSLEKAESAYIDLSTKDVVFKLE